MCKKYGLWVQQHYVAKKLNSSASNNTYRCTHK